MNTLRIKKCKRLNNNNNKYSKLQLQIKNNILKFKDPKKFQKLFILRYIQVQNLKNICQKPNQNNRPKIQQDQQMITWNNIIYIHLLRTTTKRFQTVKRRMIFTLKIAVCMPMEMNTRTLLILTQIDWISILMVQVLSLTKKLNDIN